MVQHVRIWVDFILGQELPLIVLPFEQSLDCIAAGDRIYLGKSRALHSDPMRNDSLRVHNSRYTDTIRAALGVAPALKVRIFDAAQAALHEKSWRILAREAIQPNVFFEPAFALAAAQHLTEAGQPSFVFIFDTVQSGKERLVGVFPFTRSRLDFGASMLRGWQHDYNPLGTPLVHSDRPADTLRAFFEYMAQTPCRILKLSNVPTEGPFIDALKQSIATAPERLAVIKRHFRAILASGSQPAAYFDAHWRPKKLKELRRLRRRLETMESLSFRTAKDPLEVNDALEQFFALEAAGWKGASGTALVQDTGRATFVRSMARDLSATGQVRINGLYLGKTMVAGSISLVSAGTVAFWKIAYDETYARFSPGVLLTQALTQAFLTDPEVKIVDSCAVQDHPMIDHLWHERQSIMDCLVSMEPRSSLSFHLAVRREKLRLAMKSLVKLTWKTIQAFKSDG